MVLSVVTKLSALASCPRQSFSSRPGISPRPTMVTMTQGAPRPNPGSMPRCAVVRPIRPPSAFLPLQQKLTVAPPRHLPTSQVAAVTLGVEQLKLDAPPPVVQAVVGGPIRARSGRKDRKAEPTAETVSGVAAVMEAVERRVDGGVWRLPAFKTHGDRRLFQQQTKVCELMRALPAKLLESSILGPDSESTMPDAGERRRLQRQTSQRCHTAPLRPAVTPPPPPGCKGYSGVPACSRGSAVPRQHPLCSSRVGRWPWPARRR